MSGDEWPHPTHDPETMSQSHCGDVCPWCGESIRYAGEDVIRITDRERGEVADLAPEDVSVPLVHPTCLREVSEEAPHLLRETRDEVALSTFADGGEQA